MNNQLQLQIDTVQERVNTLKAGAAKKVKLVMWLAGGIVLMLFGSAILTGIIAGTMALIFGIVVFVLVQMFPYFSKWLVNKRTELLIAEQVRHLEALKAQARANPVETLQHVYMQTQTSLSVKSDKITKFATKVNKYGQKKEDFKKKFPADAETFEKVHRDMTLLLKKRREKWEESRAKLEKLGDELERAQAIWEMTQETADLRESAGDLEEAFLQKVRTDTAFDAVQESLAASMADLDQLLMEEVDLGALDNPRAITHNPSPVLDLEDARIKQEVRR